MKNVFKYTDNVISREKADRITVDMPEGTFFTASVWMSDDQSDVYIYKDVEDMTVHAVITKYYSFNKAHILYSPAFATACQEHLELEL